MIKQNFKMFTSFLTSVYWYILSAVKCGTRQNEISRNRKVSFVNHPFLPEKSVSNFWLLIGLEHQPLWKYTTINRVCFVAEVVTYLFVFDVVFFCYYRLWIVRRGNCNKNFKNVGLGQNDTCCMSTLLSKDADFQGGR